MSEEGRNQGGERAGPGAARTAAGAAHVIERDAERREVEAQQEIEQLRERVAQLDDSHKRARADLDNYRKRSAREVERRVDEAREPLVRDWLEVVDSVERAVRAVEPENPVAPGLRALLGQMERALDRYGVRRIDAIGEEFDPERHEAVDVRVVDEGDDRRVLDVLRSGYAIDGRTLRPAQVVVSRRSGRDE